MAKRRTWRADRSAASPSPHTSIGSNRRRVAATLAESHARHQQRGKRRHVLGADLRRLKLLNMAENPRRVQAFENVPVEVPAVGIHQRHCRAQTRPPGIPSRRRTISLTAAGGKRHRTASHRAKPPLRLHQRTVSGASTCTMRRRGHSGEAPNRIAARTHIAKPFPGGLRRPRAQKRKQVVPWNGPGAENPLARTDVPAGIATGKQCLQSAAPRQ